MEWSKAQSGENLLRSTMSNEMPTNQCENSPVRSIFDVRAPLTRSAGRIKKRQSGKAKREKERRKKRVEKTIFSYREISAAKKKEESIVQQACSLRATDPDGMFSSSIHAFFPILHSVFYFWGSFLSTNTSHRLTSPRTMKFSTLCSTVVKLIVAWKSHMKIENGKSPSISWPMFQIFINYYKFFIFLD